MTLRALSAGLIATAMFASACNGAETGTAGGSSGTISSGSGGITSSGPLPPAKPKSGGALQGEPGVGPQGTGGDTNGGTASDPRQTCHAEPVQWANGRPADRQLIEKLREQSGAEIVRVLPPGLSVTQEFRYGRLNVNVDDLNVITSISCW